MGSVVLALTVLAYVVAGRAAGLTWKTLLHWAGEILLIIGIALAAVGISDVRREWTRLPGIRGHLQQATQNTQARAASFMWAGWNRAVGKWPRLAKWLHLRAHTKTVSGSAQLSGTAHVSISATGKVTIGPPPADRTDKERLAWLEAHMMQVLEQIDSMNERHEREVRTIKDATDEEQAARMAEDQRIRERMANLAGGGLKLQAWGVACLLAGTVMTAIW
jgi:hypothetical protein